MSVSETYSIDESAVLLGLSIKATRRFVASGQLKSQKTGTTYRIYKEDLELFKGSLSNAVIGFDLFGDPIYAEPKPALSRLSGAKPDEEVNWVDIGDVWQKPGSSDITFVDLFCGAGGLSKGFELAGLQGICGLDWFDEAGQTYLRNFKHPFVNGDIKDRGIKKSFYDVVKAQLKNRKLNVVAGGFPCQ
ncbi:MAG: DNA cytosine methyltransferase, partial [Thermoguttaceae bacterium]|nr:DNA cytosine methyltransferase [Thermoguttaceae bacterium]